MDNFLLKFIKGTKVAQDVQKKPSRINALFDLHDPVRKAPPKKKPVKK